MHSQQRFKDKALEQEITEFRISWESKAEAISRYQSHIAEPLQVDELGEREGPRQPGRNTCSISSQDQRVGVATQSPRIQRRRSEVSRMGIVEKKGRYQHCRQQQS